MSREAIGPFRKIAILGLGMMGGSLGKALIAASKRDENRSYRICAYDPSGKGIAGIVQCDTAQSAVEGADLIVLACPLSTYRPLLKAIASKLETNAVIIDLGSVKGLLEPMMTALLPPEKQLSWIGGHPMCGSEKSGVSSANENLYQGAIFFLTPGSDLSETLKGQVESLIQELGSIPKWVDPDWHDCMVARTSHLPHVSAVLLMAILNPSERGECEDAGPYIAGGFKEMTRIAAGSEMIWKDILLFNQKYVIEAINSYEEQLGIVKKYILNQDGTALEAFLKKMKIQRLALDQRQE